MAGATGKLPCSPPCELKWGSEAAQKKWDKGARMRHEHATFGRRRRWRPDPSGLYRTGGSRRRRSVVPPGSWRVCDLERHRGLFWRIMGGVVCVRGGGREQ
eukprot:4705372-Prymnesium_polylepis.2